MYGFPPDPIDLLLISIRVAVAADRSPAVDASTLLECCCVVPLVFAAPVLLLLIDPLLLLIPCCC